MERSDPDALASAARQGARWQTAAQVAELGSSLGTLAYLAHLVPAATFGVVSFALALTLIISTVAAAPVTRAVIAYQLDSVPALSTAWWATLGPSSLLAVLIALGAAIAGMRGDELIAVSVIAASMPIVGCASLVQAILQQRLAFRGTAAARIVAALAASAVALFLGQQGHGFAALLARAVIAPLLLTCLGMLSARWRPTFVFDGIVARKLRSYAWGVAGFSLLNQLNRYGDNLLVGAFLGSAALGYYAMAYRFIEVPVGQVGAAAQSVVFPTLARIDSPTTFRDALLRSQKVLVWVVAPVGVSAMAVGDIATPALLGNQWAPAGVIVQIFGAVALLQAGTTQVGIIYLARDATALLLRWALLSTPIVVGSFAVGLLWGIAGVAWAYLAANILLFWPGWSIPGSLVDLTPAMVLLNLKVELGWGYGLAATVLFMRLTISIESTAAIIAVIVAVSGMYWVGSALLDSRLRTDVLRLVGARVLPTLPIQPSHVK